MLLPVAQSLPDPNTPAAVGWVIGVVILLATGALVLKQLFKSDPPMHKEYVSKSDHDQFRKETLEELKTHRARRAEIYEMQKAQGVTIARLEAATEQQNESLENITDKLADVDDRINSVPQRTINLLLDAQKLAR